MDQSVIPDRGDQSKLYFAVRQGKDLGDAIFERKRSYERFVEQCGLQRVWRKMHWRYFGADPETGHSDQEVGHDGEEGELHLLMMNHLRADVTLWLNLAFSQRTEMTPEATTDDYEAELEVKRAKAAMAHYNRTAKIETKERLAGEYSGVYGMAYLMRWWNTRRGKVVAAPLPPEAAEGVAPVEGPSAEAAMKAGDLECYAVTPMDCFVDPLQRSGFSQWQIVRLYQNRHDLAADHPEKAEDILAVTSEDDSKETRGARVDLLGIARVGEGKMVRDEIPVYYFFHEDTPAVPGGRVVKLLNENLILEDFQLTSLYERSPVRRLACAEIHRTPFGYSPAWGLLAPQEAQASLSTIALSNARTFGLGTIISPKGADVDKTDFADGLKLVEYTPGLDKPSALQMPQTPQEVYIFRDTLIKEMGTLVGVNSVVRGDPEASLKSGSALAMVQATAVQFSSDFQANIQIWKEEHHFDTVTILQLNLRDDMLPEIAGDYAAALLKEFSGEDFKKIRKIKVTSVNPMAKTLAGKVQLADTLVERFPNVLTPGDYFRVIETGSIDYLTRGESQRRANLDRENELLAAGIGPKPPPQMDPMTGQPVPQVPPAPGAPRTRYVRALITDDHRAHILKHLEVLDNPAIREAGTPEAEAVINAVLDHVEEHEQQAINATLTRLTLLELTNQPPLQSVLPPPMPAGPAGAPGEKKPEGGGSAPKPPGGPSAGGASPAMQQTPPGSNQMPKQPQMPINPSTGQRVENMPGPS